MKTPDFSIQDWDLIREALRAWSWNYGDDRRSMRAGELAAMIRENQ